MRQKPLNIRASVGQGKSVSTMIRFIPLTTRLGSRLRQGRQGILRHGNLLVPSLLKGRQFQIKPAKKAQSLSVFLGFYLFSVVPIPTPRSFFPPLQRMQLAPNYTRPLSPRGRLSLSLSQSLLGSPLARSNCLTAGGHLVNFGPLRNPAEQTARSLACSDIYIARLQICSHPC